MAERDAVLRAGVQGVQEVVVYSLNKVLLHEMPEEEEARERFVTYCLAVKSFLELHVTNQDTIFGHLHASGDFAMDEFLAQRPPVDEVREMLRRIETVGKDGVSHVELFRPLADVLLPEVARVDAFFEKLDFNRVSKEAEKVRLFLYPIVLFPCLLFNSSGNIARC